LECPKQKEMPCPILINLLKVIPGKQDALTALLKQNTDAVIARSAAGRRPGWSRHRGSTAIREGTKL
jgi:hypothetical protein